MSSMERAWLMDLLTDGEEMSARLAPLLHENSKLWPHQRATLKHSFQARERPAWDMLASKVTGILLPDVGVMTSPAPVGMHLVHLATILTGLGKRRAIQSVELSCYMLAWKVQGLSDGSYFYNVAQEKLVPVRGFQGSASIDIASALIVLCGAVHCSGMQMRERYYRNLLLSAGFYAGEVIRLARDLSLSTRLVVNFLDDPLSAEIGVDPAVESPLAAVAISTFRSDEDAILFHLEATEG